MSATLRLEGIGLALGLLAAPLAVAAAAQQAGKVYRMGYLSAPSRPAVEHVRQAFLRALRERGWVEFGSGGRIPEEGESK